MNDSPQIENYRRDGVIRCRGWFSAAETAAIRAAFERYQAEVAPGLPAADYTLEADRTTIRNFWRMHEHDPFFQRLAEQPRLLELVAALVQGEPVLMGVESFNKPARVGSPVPPHQDNAYFCQQPADVLSVWIALDPANEENGAVEYFLGSQHALLPHQPSGVKGNSFGLADASAADPFPSFLGTVDAGDILVHHGQTIHQSQPNRSQHPRLSLVIVYRAAHTRTDESLQRAYQQALAATPQNA